MSFIEDTLENDPPLVHSGSRGGRGGRGRGQGRGGNFAHYNQSHLLPAHLPPSRGGHSHAHGQEIGHDRGDTTNSDPEATFPQFSTDINTNNSQVPIPPRAHDSRNQGLHPPTSAGQSIVTGQTSARKGINPQAEPFVSNINLERQPQQLSYHSGLLVPPASRTYGDQLPKPRQSRNPFRNRRRNGNSRNRGSFTSYNGSPRNEGPLHSSHAPLQSDYTGFGYAGETAHLPHPMSGYGPNQFSANHVASPGERYGVQPSNVTFHGQPVQPRARFNADAPEFVPAAFASSSGPTHSPNLNFSRRPTENENDDPDLSGRSPNPVKEASLGYPDAPSSVHGSEVVDSDPFVGDSTPSIQNQEEHDTLSDAGMRE